MKIKVTQKHIDNGKRHKPTCCPIALALIDYGFCNVSVGPNSVLLGNARIHLPKIARTTLMRFDVDLPILPFAFEFNYTEPMSLWTRIKARIFG